MTTDTLIEETIQVIKYVHSQFPDNSITIVGHSMGGAIAAKCVKKIEEYSHEYEFASNIKALFVIDVVEGTAMDALPFMEAVVQSRPKTFKSLENVVQWGIKSGTVRTIESARVSMPVQVVEKKHKESGITEYLWRTDLLGTMCHWEGMSKINNLL